MLGDDDFRALLEHLNRPWAGFRRVRRGVKKRIRRHMTDLGCTAINDYLLHLDTDAGAMAVCEAHLAVTISRFYRDRHLWTHLQDRILPDLSMRFPTGLHAWSAGCAGGEEPYSLAIVRETAAGTAPGIAPIAILATDTDPTCLARARAGRYPASSLRELPDDARRHWFHKVPGKHHYQIDESLGAGIRWQRHHLLDAPPQQTFNIVFLRNNLLTYYRGDPLNKAFHHIVDRIVTGGILVIGADERLPEDHPFLTRDSLCPWVYWNSPPTHRSSRKKGH